MFKGGETLREFLEPFDRWLSEPGDGSLLSGSAETARGLKDRTVDVEKIRDRAGSNVRTLPDDQADDGDDAIGRLVEKQILHHDEDTLQLQ